jgi:hypothetical protein
VDVCAGEATGAEGNGSCCAADGDVMVDGDVAAVGAGAVILLCCADAGHASKASAIATAIGILLRSVLNITVTHISAQ